MMRSAAAEAMRRLRLERKQKGLCLLCGKEKAREGKVFCKSCAKVKAQQDKREREKLISERRCLRCRKELEAGSKARRCESCLAIGRAYNTKRRKIKKVV